MAQPRPGGSSSPYPLSRPRGSRKCTATLARRAVSTSSRVARACRGTRMKPSEIRRSDLCPRRGTSESRAWRRPTNVEVDPPAGPGVDLLGQEIRVAPADAHDAIGAATARSSRFRRRRPLRPRRRLQRRPHRHPRRHLLRRRGRPARRRTRDAPRTSRSAGPRRCTSPGSPRARTCRTSGRGRARTGPGAGPTTDSSCRYSHALRAVHHRPCCGAITVIQSPSRSSVRMNLRSATRTYSEGAAVTCASSKKT